MEAFDCAQLNTLGTSWSACRPYIPIDTPCRYGEAGSPHVPPIWLLEGTVPWCPELRDVALVHGCLVLVVHEGGSAARNLSEKAEEACLVYIMVCAPDLQPMRFLYIADSCKSVEVPRPKSCSGPLDYCNHSLPLADPRTEHDYHWRLLGSTVDPSTGVPRPTA